MLKVSEVNRAQAIQKQMSADDGNTEPDKRREAWQKAFNRPPDIPVPGYFER